MVPESPRRPNVKWYWSRVPGLVRSRNGATVVDPSCRQAPVPPERSGWSGRGRRGTGCWPCTSPAGTCCRAACHRRGNGCPDQPPGRATRVSGTRHQPAQNSSLSRQQCLALQRKRQVPASSTPWARCRGRARGRPGPAALTSMFAWRAGWQCRGLRVDPCLEPHRHAAMS
jgi:hypothetical protein